jgi:hypothetical protein
MSDIFAYSNMYAMRKSMQWLAVASHVVDECGPYVTKPGKNLLCGRRLCVDGKVIQGKCLWIGRNCSICTQG